MVWCVDKKCSFKRITLTYIADLLKFVLKEKSVNLQKFCRCYSMFTQFF